ncbi:MAG: hypothetical protein P8X55_21925, partial [Desulfosarcinaceae bacterium]
MLLLSSYSRTKQGSNALDFRDFRAKREEKAMKKEKRSIQGILTRLPLIVIGLGAFLLGLGQPLAAEKTPQDFFGGLQKRLVADGFDAGMIKKLYADNAVYFESKGVSAYFLHNEATLDYKKMTRSPWISEARDYMSEHRG